MYPKEVTVMDMKKWIPVISIASVVVFFIWGFIEGTYEHSWITFLLAGLAMAILKAMDKKKDRG